MPGMNGQGPMNEGPMTGRGTGMCRRQGDGLGRGLGRGGRGGGMARGAGGGGRGRCRAGLGQAGNTTQGLGRFAGRKEGDDSSE